MLISEVIEKLKECQDEFGDIEVTIDQSDDNDDSVVKDILGDVFSVTLYNWK